MDTKKLIPLIFGAVAIIALVWAIFVPRPEKFEEADPGTAIGSGWRTYSHPGTGDGDWGFSIQYPPGFTPDPAYVNETLGPGREISGVSFTIPESMANGSNLSEDTRLSVERQAGVACTPADFVAVSANAGEDASLGNYDYTYVESTDAGAGNLYDEYVYMMKRGEDSCVGIRFFIHSTQIANYEPGTIREFDRDSLLQIFRDMAATLVIR